MSTGSLKIALFGLVATVLAAAQLGQLSVQTTPAPNDGKVRVYVYRPGELSSKEFRPSIFVDERETARMQSGRSVILALSAGSHSFRSTDKKDAVQLDLKAGHKYFIKVDVSSVALKGHAKLTTVLPEQGTGEFAQTKPVDNSMLKDRLSIAPEFVGAK